MSVARSIVSGSGANKAASSSEAWKNVSSFIKETVVKKLDGINKEVASRSYRGSNELRNASLYVLRGQRSGKRYRVPYTKRSYAASAPGEPPAVRTGIFRLSWGTHIHVEKQGKVFRAVSAIESNVKVGKYLLGDILEHGTKRMAPRPYKQAIKNMTMPKAKAIYRQPYKI